MSDILSSCKEWRNNDFKIEWCRLDWRHKESLFALTPLPLQKSLLCYALSFLHIPPHDGHPFCSTMYLPLPGHVKDLSPLECTHGTYLTDILRTYPPYCQEKIRPIQSYPLIYEYKGFLFWIDNPDLHLCSHKLNELPHPGSAHNKYISHSPKDIFYLCQCHWQ